MADNLRASAGTNDGPTFATDEDTSVVPARHFTGQKIMLGADGVFTAYWDGSVNAGTNLNTSALALESGGNLATVAGAVSGSEMQVDVVTLPNEGQQTMANSISVALASDQSSVPVDLGANNDVQITDGSVNATITTAGSNECLDVIISGTDGTLVNLNTAALTTDNVNIATSSLLLTAGFGLMFDGTVWDRIRGDSTDGLLVNLGTNNDVQITDGSVNATITTAGSAECQDVIIYNDSGAATNFITSLLILDGANIATTPVLFTGAFGMVFNGATWDRARGDATDGTLVNLGANNDVRITDAAGDVANVRSSISALDVAVLDADGNQAPPGAINSTEMFDGDNGVALTPKFATANIASAGNTAVVAAVAGKTIRVLSMQVIQQTAANTIYFNDGTGDLYGASTAKIPMDVVGVSGMQQLTLPFNPVGWFETGANNRPINLNATSGAGFELIVTVTYVEI